jgi:hypothetical protein
MLNYTFGARSKRYLQIVDEVPEEVYRLLINGNAGLETSALAEPDDIPKDEKTEEFIAARAGSGNLHRALSGVSA